MEDTHILEGLSSRVFVLLMCFVGGFVESAGYMKLFGLFTSSITGNLTVAAIAVFHHDEGVLARVLVTVFYGLGAFIVASCAHTVKQSCQLSRWDVELISLVQELVALLAATVLGVSLIYTTIQSWQCILTGSVMALAMGIQSAVVLLFVKDSPSTTVMTANITKASVAAANTLHTALYMGDAAPEQNKHRAARARFVEMSLVIVAFVVGAGAGAVITISAGLWSLIVPDAVLAAVAIGVFVGRARQQRSGEAGPRLRRAQPAREGTALNHQRDHRPSYQSVS